MRAAFIVNPASAGGKTYRLFNRLRPKIDAAFPGAEIYFTAYPGHARLLAAECAQKGLARLIGVGGDGTFHEIVNGLFSQQKPINPHLVFGTLPLGTGSDLIRSLGIARCPEKALVDLVANRYIHSNVGFVTLQGFDAQPIERYFINLFNFGVGGLTSLLVNQKSKALGGKITFLHGTLEAILKFQSRAVSIKVNQQKFYQGRIKNVALANGRYCGGGMIMAPGARVDSGHFQLVLVEDLPTFPFLLQLPKIYWGRHLGLKHIKSCFVHSLEVETEADDIILEMDGETPGKLPLKATCLQKALAVNVGKNFH